MEVVEGNNYDILNYLLETFKELTKFRIKSMIELQEYSFPEVGPSDDLQKFPEMLKDWEDSEVMEVKNIIKLYDSGEIESVEEVIILIEILKRKSDNYPEILDIILNDFQKQEFKNLEHYCQLLDFSQDSQDAIIYNAIWNYLMISLS